MCAIIRKNWKLAKIGNFLLLFIVCLFFSVSAKSSGCLSFEQHLLSAGTDHYYLLYAMIPITLFCFFPFLEDDSEIVIGRFKSYFAYFFSRWSSMGLIAVCLVITQTIAISISAIGLPHQNDWLIPADAPTAELFSHFESCFPNPCIAFLAIIAYQCFGSWFVCGFLMWICHFGKIRMTLWVLLPIYAFSALWIKIPILQALPITGFNHLMILHHNFGDSFRMILTAGTGAILFIAVILTSKYCWRKTLGFPSKRRFGLTTYYLRLLFSRRNLIVVAAVVVLIVAYKALRGMAVSSMDEWIIEVLSGHGIGNFRPIVFLEMLLVNGTPLYFMASFLEKTVSGQSLFVPIRAGSRIKLTASTLYACLSFLFVYTLFLGVIIMGSGYLFGIPLVGSQSISLLFKFLALKLIDCCIQCFVLMLVHGITGQVIAGFILLIGGNMLCMLPEWISCFLPFGISSTARLITSSGSKSSMILVFIFMALLGALLISSLFWASKKKEFN
ncbi:hypothetical protein [Blautia pseudococcoides]|uniref:Uncharacterized protein n=1 Tax=Blautia pseudococcoides TaxID=1796616 RepID=A0A1C7IAK2_9FIRM|nr:hypothetical protein [Blautia pseudococcoides]ANU75944.1 hypothetical protein A4V09_09325 [Blautia pseudococcoides]ASU28755.1 hypothetical protein ADH70_007750 [Blautia pseudococcoides]QQQ93518.1 hypothetical protein I5Q86_01540 [Blautia pseudococcoides]